MRIESLAAIAIAVLAAGTGLAVNPVGSLPSEKQSMMGAAQVGDRLAASVDFVSSLSMAQIRAATQPIKVQPRKMFSLKIAPSWRWLRTEATIDGMK